VRLFVLSSKLARDERGAKTAGCAQLVKISWLSRVDGKALQKKAWPPVNQPAGTASNCCGRLKKQARSVTMKKAIMIGLTAVAIGSATPAMSAEGFFDRLGDRIDSRLDARGERRHDRLDARGARVDERLDAKGNRIDDRLDARGDRINDRLDNLADKARAQGRTKRADRLDLRGDRINQHLDSRGNRINARLDRRGDRIENHLDRRGNHVEHRYDHIGDRINRRLDRRDWHRHP
jgi:hypothetical protein